MRRVAVLLLAVLAVEAAALSALVASAQPTRTLPMRRVVVEVCDRVPPSTHVVIEGALP
nr:MAG TPA: hypothetical protein [Caudoviricetes sp.]